MRTYLLIAGIAMLASCATPVPPTDVPDVLKPPAGESFTMLLAARGVQVYECRAGANDAHAWTFVAPEAELFDHKGKRVGHHDAGPRWHFADGSRVVGAVKQRADAPQAGAIPWLLLTARAEGPVGSSAGIASIQRIHTVGGVAPSSGCSRDRVGASARVDYTADYTFYRSAP